jgi:hypothetical protein
MDKRDRNIRLAHVLGRVVLDILCVNLIMINIHPRIKLTRSFPQFLSYFVSYLENPKISRIAAMSSFDVSHPLSYNMHLGHGILSERLSSNTFDAGDVERSNRITESDLNWLLAVQNSSTGHVSECSRMSEASAVSASDLNFDILKLSS